VGNGRKSSRRAFEETQSEIHHKSDLDHRRSGEKPLRVESDASDFANGSSIIYEVRG